MPLIYENIKVFDYQQQIMEAIASQPYMVSMESRQFIYGVINYGFAPVPPPAPFKESEVPSIFSKHVEFLDMSITGAGK